MSEQVRIDSIKAQIKPTDVADRDKCRRTIYKSEVKSEKEKYRDQRFLKLTEKS